MTQSVAQAELTKDTAHKVELLQHDVEVKLEAIDKRYLHTNIILGILAGVAAVGTGILGFLGYLKDKRLQKNYEEERGRLQTNYEEERKLYRHERGFYERGALRSEKQERRAANAEIANIGKLGDVVDLVTKTFDLRFQREKNQAELEKKWGKMEGLLNRLVKDGRGHYEDLKSVLAGLEKRKAMEWPTLSDEWRPIVTRARNTYDAIPGFVIDDIQKEEPASLARVHHLIGIASYYADNDVATAFKHLQEADRIYDEPSLRDTPEVRNSRGYTKHFLGVLEKNWLHDKDDEGENLQRAHDYLKAADDMFETTHEQFLTPLTLGEVLSYRSDWLLTAEEKLQRLIHRITTLKREKERTGKKLNANQHDILARATLLLGNLEFLKATGDRGRQYYDTALDLNPKNSFALLSLALVSEPEAAIPMREQGLKSLNSGALAKRETTTRTVGLAWAVIAAHHCHDRNLSDYHKSFDLAEASARSVASRTPLFFSPLSKTLVKYEHLSMQLAPYS